MWFKRAFTLHRSCSCRRCGVRMRSRWRRVLSESRRVNGPCVKRKSRESHLCDEIQFYQWEMKAASCMNKPTAWLRPLCEEPLGSVSGESSGCSVRVRTLGGAFMFRRSTGGTDWIRSKSLGWAKLRSPSSPVDTEYCGARISTLCLSSTWRTKY